MKRRAPVAEQADVIVRAQRDHNRERAAVMIHSAPCRRCGDEFQLTEYQARNSVYLCSPCQATEHRNYRKTARARNRAFITELNARTACAHCGKQPIEWHNPEHVELNRQHYRIGYLVGTGAQLAAIQAELLRCTPLCRRCHMIEDGRFAPIRAFVPPKQPAKPCTDCRQPYKPLRNGRCSRCDQRYRRNQRAAS